MFCQNCGNQVADGTQICNRCGAILTNQSSQPGYQPNPINPQMDAAVDKKEVLKRSGSGSYGAARALSITNIVIQSIVFGLGALVEIIALIALAIFKDDIDNLSDTLGGIDFLSETTSLIIAIICGFFILQIVSFVLFTVFQNKGMSKISVGFSIAALVFSFLNTGEVYLFFREAAFEVSVAVFVISLIIQAIVCVLVGMCNSTYNSYVCSAGGYAPNQYDQNQYAPNQYAPNQYDQNQYVPNQYAPNQYGANPDMQNIPDSQQQYSNWQ